MIDINIELPCLNKHDIKDQLMSDLVSLMILLTINLWETMTNISANKVLIQTGRSNGSRINLTGGFNPGGGVMNVTGE